MKKMFEQNTQKASNSKVVERGRQHNSKEWKKD